jgi:tetratricopeptide (TPR) repeat protein
VDRAKASIPRQAGVEIVSVGVASWPCLDFTRANLPGNCLKALLHGSFLAPGSVVFFDHLTLNISGDVFFEDGDYRAAIKEYRRGLKWRPGDVNLINSLGVALVECNQERQAAACFQEVLDKEPDNYMALVNLGNVRRTQGQQALAVDCFERALRVPAGEEATRQELLSSLARLYTDLGRFDEATPILEEWRTLPGSDREYLLFRLLGQNFLETGRPEEAIVSCQRALQLFPQDSISMSILGLLYVEQGEGSEVGAALCRKALALDPYNPDHWCRLARALLHSGERDGALEAVRRCLQLRRGHAEGRLLLGALHQLAGRRRQAERCFRRAAALPGCSSQQVERARARLTGLSKGSRSER